ncbi:uncharacterized protein LOC110983538 isoform X2 [Acanthaster planci]|uniref:Uncharacterized protein LOC110983538 isoform X2 n=1 Tax=Acanthaster planci TaxID=133434 RepID=A0A8B7YYW9_ACAPL|nr:uncharacterized protein LOC110983538 isoform X2 [Acanthaster planci]
MARLFFLLVALSLAAFALAREERLNEVNRHLLELLKRLEGRQIEKPVEKISASNGEREVNLTGSRDVIVKQSSALPGWRLWLVADKAVDGRYSDSNFLGEDGKEYGGSCTITNSQKNPYWRAHFREEICISKVSILNRGDGFSERMTDAVVQFGYSPYRKLNANPTCGSPVTAEQAAVPGGTIEVECSEPMGGRFLTIGIPADNATLQLCEIRVWAIPMDQCPDEIKAETELDVERTSVGQSSIVGNEYSSRAALKVRDGQYNNSNLLGEGGEMYGGSCTITKAQKDPYWGMMSFKEYCFSKVWILNRGDGFSERLTGAVVRIGSEKSTDLNNNTACGSPVTAEQAAVPGGTIEVECSHPIKGFLTIIGIPADNATLQLCEVRAWVVPMAQCSPDFEECSSDPCQNGATCVDGINKFSCTCAAGFTGPLCESDVDECGSDPCLNGATCVDGVNEVSCTCAAGYLGVVCEIDTNECVSNPCQNGATCVDGINKVSCKCLEGFTRSVCETAVRKMDGCTTNPCKNGICIAYGVDGVKCACAPGYQGTICEINIDECSSNPCQNDAKCVDGINKVSCICASGFSGELCQIEQADGLPDNLPQLPQGFSLAGTKVETQTSYMQVNLITEYCIKKVIVHKSGDCTSNRLTGAVVRGGTSSTSLNNSVCGTPLTAQQVEIRRSTVDFVCDPPMTAKFVTVDIPLLRVSQKPLCEVTIEQATPGPC